MWTFNGWYCITCGFCHKIVCKWVRYLSSSKVCLRAVALSYLLVPTQNQKRILFLLIYTLLQFQSSDIKLLWLDFFFYSGKDRIHTFYHGIFYADGNNSVVYTWLHCVLHMSLGELIYKVYNILCFVIVWNNMEKDREILYHIFVNEILSVQWISHDSD